MFKPQTKSEWALFGTTAAQAGVNTAIQLSVVAPVDLHVQSCADVLKATSSTVICVG